MRSILACAACKRALTGGIALRNAAAFHSGRAVAREEEDQRNSEGQLEGADSTTDTPRPDAFASASQDDSMQDPWTKLFAQKSFQVDSPLASTHLKYKPNRLPRNDRAVGNAFRATLDSDSGEWNLPSSSSSPLRRPRSYDRDDRLTEPEVAAFKRILDVASSGSHDDDFPRNESPSAFEGWGTSGHTPRRLTSLRWRETVDRIARHDGGDDATLGSFTTSSTLDSFTRSVQQRSRTGRERNAQRRLQARLGMADRDAAAVIMEGLAAKVSAQDMARTLDQARQELELCENESQVWRWAATEVWGEGAEAEATEVAAATNEADMPVSSDSTDTLTAEGAQVAHEDASSSPLTASGPKYGLLTAFYAPVLHLLFTHLRDRFQAPHSALSVLRISRQLGPSSLVLGGTAALYAEAVRTRWNVLGDAAGVLETLKEAREAGVLLSAPEAAPIVQRPAEGEGAAGDEASQRRPKAEDEPIRTAIERVRSDVRTRAIRDQKMAGAHLVHLFDADLAARAQRGEVPLDLAPIADTSFSNDLLRIGEAIKKLAGTSRRTGEEGGREGGMGRRRKLGKGASAGYPAGNAASETAWEMRM